MINNDLINILEIKDKEKIRNLKIMEIMALFLFNIIIHWFLIIYIGISYLNFLIYISLANLFTFYVTF